MRTGFRSLLTFQSSAGNHGVSTMSPFLGFRSAQRGRGSRTIPVSRLGSRREKELLGGGDAAFLVVVTGDWTLCLDYLNGG